jgi:streptomycin 6-kinase
MMALKKAQNTTLTGIVIPVNWNDDQEVTEAALATADEKEYRIGGNRKGKELLSFLQHQVEVTGTLSRDEKGRAVITVRRYFVK